MEKTQAWLVMERYENWLMDKERGFNILGFQKRKQPLVNNMKKGDKLVIYIASRRSAIAAIYEIISEKPYYSNELLWDEIFPIRIQVHPEIILPEERFVPIQTKELMSKLSFLRGLKDWRQCFRGSIRKIDDHDYMILRNAVYRNASKTP